jgi:hypothetical protein
MNSTNYIACPDQRYSNNNENDAGDEGRSKTIQWRRRARITFNASVKYGIINRECHCHEQSRYSTNNPKVSEKEFGLHAYVAG